MKKLAIVLITLLLAVSTLTACGKGSAKERDSWSRIKKDKQVIIGLDDTFVPMGFRDKQDNIVGFDVDLAKAVFDKYNIKVKFQPIDWTMKESELKNGSIDLIWNGYTVNDKRKKQVDFSAPYMKNEQVIVTKKKSGIQKFSDMKGKILGAQNGASSLDDMAKKPAILTDIIKGEPTLFDTFNEAFIDLNAGRIDGLIIDGVYARYYLNKQKDKANYRIVTAGGFEPTDFAVGIRKGDKELQTKINQAFKELYQSGKMQAISKKWFASNAISPQK